MKRRNSRSRSTQSLPTYCRLAVCVANKIRLEQSRKPNSAYRTALRQTLAAWLLGLGMLATAAAQSPPAQLRQTIGDTDSTTRLTHFAIDVRAINSKSANDDDADEDVKASLWAEETALHIWLEQDPAVTTLELPRLHFPLKRVTWRPADSKSIAATTDLRFHQDAQHWRIDLPAQASYPLAVTLEAGGKIVHPDALPTLAPSTDGSLVLRACRGVPTGEKLQFEPLLHKNTIGYWVNPADSVAWEFTTPDQQTWEVHVLQGCGRGQGGSRVAFEFSNTDNQESQTLEHEVVETGHFQNFRWCRVGTIELAAEAEHRLTVACRQLANAAVMDIRQIRLVPTDPVNDAPQDLRLTPPDVILPALRSGGIGPGQRGLVQLENSNETVSEVQHVVGLPTDWRAGGSYPLLVEFAGNGPYRNDLGDTNSGLASDTELAWGLSGGDGWITLSVPFLNAAGDQEVTQWWGDAGSYEVTPTLDYLNRAIDATCRDFGADRERVVLIGFSRGALACSVIGLHDDSVAQRWKGILAYSHFDGLRTWPYPDSDRTAAETRLRRLSAQPVMVLDEDAGRLNQTRAWIESLELDAPFTFETTGYLNHDDAWTLRPGPARRSARKWLAELVDLPPRQDSL